MYDKTRKILRNCTDIGEFNKNKVFVSKFQNYNQIKMINIQK